MGSVSSPILVGRDRELARLLEAIETANTGRPQLVVVSGEAGIGKSRLMTEVVARARADGSRIMAGGCLDIGDAGVPYVPLAEALRSLARAVPADELADLLGPTRDDLATIAPELAEGGEVAHDPAEVGSIGQARLFERMLELLGRLSQERPVIVVVEDVQWIDRATRDLVTFLVRNVTSEKIAAFLTVRTEDLPRGHPNLAWLAELNRAPGGVRVPVQPLDRDGIANQLAAIRGDTPQPDVVDRIWRRSEGNPLFAEELLAVDGTDGSSASAPTLVEVLLARLRALDDATAEVVTAAAIAGRPVDERLLCAVLDRPRADLRPSLREAIARHVLVEDASGDIRVRHELLREVVEQQLLAGERRDLHERFAEVLTAEPALADPSPTAAAAELARHWAAAGRIHEAHHAAIAAGRAAESVHAHADAHREYEAARTLEAQLPADRASSLADRLDLRRRAADAADLAGHFDRAIELTREALVLAEELGDDVVAGLLHGRLGYLLWAAGDAAAGLAEHREAVRLVPESPPTAERARVLGGLASSLMAPGGYEESAKLARSAIACAEAAGATAEEARARNVLGFDLVALGRPEVGLEEMRRSRDLAATGAPPDMLVIAYYNLALNLAEAGELDEALAEALAGRDAARRVGLERRFGFDLAALAGDVLLRLGRWDEAEAVTADALRLDPAGRGSAFLSAVRGRLEAWRGDLTSALHRFDQADRLGGREDPDIDAYVAASRASVELARGRPGAALDVIERSIETHGATHALFVRVPLLAAGLRAAADLADAARAGREPALATEATRRARALLDDLRGVVPGVTSAPTLLVVDVARAEAARGGWSEAEAAGSAAWIDLAERLAARDDVYMAAYAWWRAGEAELRTHGTRSDAERMLRTARETADRLGAIPMRDEVDALARRARIALEPERPAAAHDAEPSDAAPEPAGPSDGVAALRRAGLSAREIEVLRLVAAGRTNGQIAERLFITRKTAGVHVTHILDKLAVANRVEAAMVAARLGLEPDAAQD